MITSNEETKEKELYWERVDFNTKKIQTRNHFSLDMGEYIVILGAEISSSQQEHSILDTKRRVVHRLLIANEEFQDELKDMEGYIAWHWKDNQIIILGQKRDASGIERTHLGWLAIPSIRPGTEKIIASFQCFPVNQELGVEYFTGSIYKDKLYIILSAKSEDEGSGWEKRIYSLDLEKGGSEMTLLCKFQSPFEDHDANIFQDIIYVFPQVDSETTSSNMTTRITFDINTSEIKTVAGESSLMNQLFVQSLDIDGKEYLFPHNSHNTNYQTLWIQDLETQEWKKYSTRGESPHVKGQMVKVEERIYIIGGENDDGTESKDIWCLPLPPQKSSKNLSQLDLSDPSVILKLLFTEAPYHDITFEVESELIPAHKWLLTKRSKYFANMFSSGMVETQSSKIVIPDMKAHTFKALIEFLYTNQIEPDADLAIELFKQADKYVVPELKKSCEQYLCNSLNPENYVRIANLAETLDASALREATLAYIARNVKALRSRQDLAKISNDMLKDVIFKITENK